MDVTTTKKDYPITVWNVAYGLLGRNYNCFISQTVLTRIRSGHFVIGRHLSSSFIHYTLSRNRRNKEDLGGPSPPAVPRALPRTICPFKKNGFCISNNNNDILWTQVAKNLRASSPSKKKNNPNRSEVRCTNICFRFFFRIKELSLNSV